MTPADGIQLIIAAGTLAAAVAAWVAARSSQKSATQIRESQQIEAHRQRTAMLQELLGLVASLADGVHPLQPGEGYMRGARIRGLIVAINGDLIHCEKLGRAMEKLNAPAELIPKAEAEIRWWIAHERRAIDRLESDPSRVTASITGLKRPSLLRPRSR